MDSNAFSFLHFSSNASNAFNDFAESMEAGDLQSCTTDCQFSGNVSSGMIGSNFLLNFSQLFETNSPASISVFISSDVCLSGDPVRCLPICCSLWFGSPTIHLSLGPGPEKPCSLSWEDEPS